MNELITSDICPHGESSSKCAKCLLNNREDFFNFQVREYEKKIQERDELIRDAVAIISFLNPFKAGKSAQWVEKAKKLVGEK